VWLGSLYDKPEHMNTAAQTEHRPLPVIGERPVRPLSAWQIIKGRGTNSLALFDEDLFDEAFAERRFLWYRAHIVNDPAGVRRVLVDNFANYHTHPLKSRPLAPGLGSGMLINSGTLWRRHRDLLNPIMDYRATLADAPVLVRWTEILAQHLAALPAGEPIDIGQALSLLLAASGAEVFAGDAAEVQQMLVRMAKYPGRRRASDYLPIPNRLRPRSRQIRAEAQQWYPLLDRLIAARTGRDYPGSRDLVWRLVHARNREGGQFSHQEVRDEVLTLALGSIETTLRPLCWIWYLLALHPWAEERLHAELDRVLAGRSPSPDDLQHLGYLRRVVDETMRLYPPVPVIVRQAVADDVVCGHPISPRSLVIVAPWVIHRHRRLWCDPDSFNPDRFLPQHAAGRSRYAYLPFSVGPRTCIAAPLAIMQIHIAVAILASRFRFRLVAGHSIEPTGWTTLRPNRGIVFTVERR
jgi:cytochrome P450